MIQPVRTRFADLDDATATSARFVPAGGTSGQVLAKSSGTDYATHWADAATGGGGGTPGGSSGQVQFNDAGSFAGDSGLTYNGTTDTLTLAGTLVTASASTYQAKFGGTLPFYVMANNPTLGFNAYYSGGWLYGTTGYGGIVDFGASGDGSYTLYTTAASGTGGAALTLVSRFKVYPTGSVFFGSNPSDLGSAVAVQPNSSSAVGAIVRAAASQSADLQQWQDSSGNVLSAVGPAGHIRTVTGSGAPSSTPADGALYVDTASSKLYARAGGAWSAVGGSTYSTFVASGASHAGGLVPDPGSTAGTTRFLREDATFAVPAATVASGTSGRVPYEAAGGVLTDSTNLTFDGTNLVYLCGASGGSPLVVRQAGGTAGTQEVQVLHDGSQGKVVCKAGNLWLVSGTGSTVVYLPGKLEVAGDIQADTSITFAGKTMLAFGATIRIQAPFSSIPITAAQITADRDDYAPGVARFYRLSSDASRNITGLSASQQDGQDAEIWNVGSNPIVLKHASSSSLAANRFVCVGSADITLAANAIAVLRYDGTTGAWRVR